MERADWQSDIRPQSQKGQATADGRGRANRLRKRRRGVEERLRHGGAG